MAIKISSVLKRICIEDDDGNKLFFAMINAGDPAITGRCKQFVGFLEKKKKELSEKITVEDMLQLSNDLEKEFCSILNVTTSPFIAPMTPVTILPDGQLFAQFVMDEIYKVVGEVATARGQKMKNRMNEYLEKYQ